jgi:hypothetical protein
VTDGARGLIREPPIDSWNCLINSPGLPLQPTKSLFFARVVDTWTSALNDRAPDRGIGRVLICLDSARVRTDEAKRSSFRRAVAIRWTRTCFPRLAVCDAGQQLSGGDVAMLFHAIFSVPGAAGASRCGKAPGSGKNQALLDMTPTCEGAHGQAKFRPPA